MSNELSPELKSKIAKEATSSDANFHYYPGSETFEDLESAYVTGASKYAENWQESEQRAARYERALKWLRAYAINSQNNGTIPSALVIYSTINQALTPKQTTDDTTNR